MFEVQTFTLINGWVNTWFEENQSGSHPMRYLTEEAAETDIACFIKEMRDDVRRGNVFDAPTRGDFRIVEVENA